MMAPGSFFEDAYHFYHRHARNKTIAAKCSICASMYIHSRQNGPSYMDHYPDIVDHTPAGLYVRIKNKSSDRERLEKCLCYGSALYHTDREFNHIEHMLSQYALLKDAINILVQRKIDLFDKKPVIVYIKMNNGLVKAMKSSGTKVKHPHVWIMKELPKYNEEVFHTDYPDPDEDHYEFLNNHLIFADSLMDLHPGKNIYLKFYMEISPYVSLDRCEIDIV